MMNKFFKSNWQTIAAVAFFLIISCIYFSPALDGYSIQQGDIKSHRGMAKEITDYKEMYNEELLWTGTSFSGMPSYQISVNYLNPLQNVYYFLIRTLSVPVFFMFFAFLSFYILARSFNVGFYIAIIGALSYGLMTYNIDIISAGHNSKMSAIAFIPGVVGGFVMLYRRKKIILPFLTLSLFFSMELMANHIQMTYYFSFVLIAIGIAEFINYLNRKELKKFIVRTGMILGAVIIALMMNFANYYNTYQFAKKTMRGKEVISISANDNTEVDNRTEEEKKYDKFNQTTGLKRDYITEWSYGKGETWNLLIPTAKGDKSADNKLYEIVQKSPKSYPNVAKLLNQSKGKRVFNYYWGDQPFTGAPNYLGAISIFLALLYLIFVNTPLKWSLLGVSILAIMLSWGKNLGGSIEDMWLTNFFIDYVPLYSKFRAVSSILVIVNLITPLMGVLFLTYLYKNLEWAKKNIKNILITGTGIIVIVFVVASSSSLIDFLSQQEQDQVTKSIMSSPNSEILKVYEELKSIRHEIFMEDAWRTIGLMVLALGLVLLSIYKENFKKIALVGIALLVVIDMWNINTRYLNNEKDSSSGEYYAWQKGSVDDNPFTATQGDLTIYQIESSQNPNIQKQVNDQLLQLQKKGNLTKQKQEAVMFASLNFNTNYRVMDLDNPFNSARVSYFHKSSGGYNPAKLKRYQDIIDFYIQKELSYLNTRQFDKMKVLNMLNNKYYLYNGQLFAQNTKAYGNAWFVNDVRWVKDNNSEILAIENTDVEHIAIIHNEFKEVITDVKEIDSNASVKMTNYLPNHISYVSNSNKDGLAIFSEVYYEDGWSAYIDGVKVPYARANYILRALNIPKGQHTIDFKFEPSMYSLGNTINLIGFLILLGGTIFFVYSQIRSKSLNNLINE